MVNKNSKYFLEKLVSQRIKSDKIFDKFKEFLSAHEKVVNVIMVKTAIEQYGDVKDFRKKIDRHKVSIFEILNFYSRLVGNLIESTNTLDTRFINKMFFIKMRNYRELMSIGEINGKRESFDIILFASKTLDKRSKK